MNAEVGRLCAARALAAGRAIRDAVRRMPALERCQPAWSRLKARNIRADASAEKVGLDHLTKLAREIGHRIVLLLDDRGATETIGSSGGPVVWAMFDAIDGTKKVGHIRPRSRTRVDAANDGAWAATFAFTAPTSKPFAELVLGDFTAAAVVDGNPTRYRSYPQDVIVEPARRRPVAYEVSGRRRRRVFTSSCRKLGQCWVLLDSFQAFDRETRQRGDERLTVELYRLLIDRHSSTGAHDVLRQFGSLSALCRSLLGWREKPVWIESQGGAFLIVNENLPNLIPSVCVVAGAGGVSVDFDGEPLRRRRLAAGRSSVIHAANAALRDHCLRVVQRARRDA